MIVPGQKIGNYEIVEKIGEGGMGEVFKARDVALRRDLAIKVLRQELADKEELLERFRHEAIILAGLNHHNIAILYGFLGSYSPYCMVMEFAKGETLLKFLRRNQGCIPLSTTIDIFSQVLAGIEHAHARGIIHRDIKPANIMVNEKLEVKVMDFGIGRIMEDNSLTKTGVLMGSVKYMSPEQVLGKSVDARSDVYSLGVLLYEMLSGYVPFNANSEFGILKAHVELAPRKFSDLNLSVPPIIEALVMRALSKNPDERFSDAGDFKRNLNLALTKIQANPPSLEDDDITVVKSSSASKTKQSNVWEKPIFIGVSLLIVGCITILSYYLDEHFLRRFEEAGVKNAGGSIKSVFDELDEQVQAEKDARKRAEDAQRLLAKEAARRAELEAKRQAELEAQRKAAELEVKRQAELEVQRKAAELEAKRQAELEAQRKSAELEATRQAEQEAQRKAAALEAKRQAELEAQRKAAELEATRQAEQEAQRRAAELEAKRQAELEAQRKAAELEATRQAEQEAQRRAAELEATRQAEQEAQRRAAELEAKRQAKQEAQRKAAELEATRQAEQEAQRRAAELEATRQAEQEAQRRAAELEAKRQAKQEAQRKAAELKAKRQAEQEAQRKAAELEAKRQAEQEAQRKAAELEAKRHAELEAQRKAAELEAKRQAEQEAQRRAADLDAKRLSEQQNEEHQNRSNGRPSSNTNDVFIAPSF